MWQLVWGLGTAQPHNLPDFESEACHSLQHGSSRYLVE
jgi:hypothetical protein